MSDSMTGRSTATARPRADTHERTIAWWLIACCFMVFAMAIIGAITRLTESGLSITVWEPLTGWRWPMNEAEWQAAFDLYRDTPHYTMVMAGMSMAEFQWIFFWEWFHRVWGRLIGVVYALPLLYFLIRGMVPDHLRLKLFGLLALGGLQAFVGWFMVASGLEDRPSVSHYRLAMHLGLAFVIYALMLGLALSLLRGEAEPVLDERADRLRGWLWALTGLTGVTIIWGAFVAGLDAGRIYNEFPLMGGRLMPEDMWFLAPAWLNIFENQAAVQFTHRALAVATTMAALAFWLVTRHFYLTPLVRTLSLGLALAVLLQAGLGIATLLTGVNIIIATLHQAGGLLVLSLLTALLVFLRSDASVKGELPAR